MRPSKDQWAISLAQVTAARATCLRRQVGCVLLNARGHVLATGYNGVAAGQKHCNEEEVEGIFDTPDGKCIGIGVETPISLKTVYPHSCPGAYSASGTNLDACQAIHAEQNALLQCRDVYAIHTCYVTASPCITCVKLLLNTSCEKIVFTEEYPHKAAQDLWVQAGRVWQQLT
jgi:dCMP deaminase